MWLIVEVLLEIVNEILELQDLIFKIGFEILLVDSNL